jgi:hypothetical protein
MAGMKVRDIATAVAAELGDGWTASNGTWEDGSDAYLNGPDVRVYVHMSRSYATRGRMVISGALAPEQQHVFVRTDGRRPEITASPTKAPRLIAGDIRRRLLPDLRTLVDKLNARVYERQAAALVRDARVKALADNIPGARVSGDDPRRVDFGTLSNGGHLVQESDGDVRFEFRLPLGKAPQLAEFLGYLMGGKA